MFLCSGGCCLAIARAASVRQFRRFVNLFSRGLPLVYARNCLNCHGMVNFLGVFLRALQRGIVLIVLIVIVFLTQEMK